MSITDATAFSLAEVQETISELQEKLLSAHPEMPVLLRKIHTKLKADPALVTLLTEEEISQIVNGLKHVTNIQLTSSTTKKESRDKPASASKRLAGILSSSKISAADF
jgi:hypothetical protein